MARMVVVVAVAFIASWSPLFIVNMVSQFQKASFLRRGNFLFTMLMTHLFGFFNSCINPFVYTVMSEKFRISFAKIIACMFGVKLNEKGLICCRIPRTFSSHRSMTSDDNEQDIHLSDMTCSEKNSTPFNNGYVDKTSHSSPESEMRALLVGTMAETMYRKTRIVYNPRTKYYD